MEKKTELTSEDKVALIANTKELTDAVALLAALYFDLKLEKHVTLVYALHGKDYSLEFKPKSEPQTIAEQIKEARIASGMTREQWAINIGVSRANTYRLEKLGYNCKIQVLKNICKINDQIICISKET